MGPGLEAAPAQAARPLKPRAAAGPVPAGTYRPNVDRVFALDDIVAAHRFMEDDRAAGQLVLLPWPAYR
ncbi:zinc-binding dehydrogenase [Streptomyces sp. NPDC001102]